MLEPETIKELRKAIEGMPDDAKVFVCVIDDVYSGASGFHKMYLWKDVYGRNMISELDRVNEDREADGRPKVETNCLLIGHWGD